MSEAGWTTTTSFKARCNIGRIAAAISFASLPLNSPNGLMLTLKLGLTSANGSEYFVIATRGAVVYFSHASCSSLSENWRPLTAATFCSAVTKLHPGGLTTWKPAIGLSNCADHSAAPTDVASRQATNVAPIRPILPPVLRFGFAVSPKPEALVDPAQ